MHQGLLWNKYKQLTCKIEPQRGKAMAHVIAMELRNAAHSIPRQHNKPVLLNILALQQVDTLLPACQCSSEL